VALNHFYWPDCRKHKYWHENLVLRKRKLASAIEAKALFPPILPLLRQNLNIRQGLEAEFGRTDQ
jgi:hypothetical protein